MEYGRALSWSRAVTGLFLARPDDFVLCWQDERMSDALAAFLFLRRHARTNLPQDAISAYDLTLRLPVGSEASRSQAQHHFTDCLLRLLHRAFYRLCTVGHHTNVSFLQRATQVARRSVEHCPLKDDHRTMFLATRSTVLQIWFMHTADAESMCLSIVLSQRRLHVTPIDQVDFQTARSFAQHFWDMGISRAGPRAYIMDTVIAFLRDILQRCPAGHPLAQGLGDDLAEMLKSRRTLPRDSSLYDEMMAVNMQSLLGQISTEPAMIDSHMSLSLAVLDRFHETRNYDRLSDARRLWEIALQRCPWDHPSRPALCYSAGSACLALHENSGEYSLLGQAIQLHRQALACTPADGPDRETICRSLSVLLQKSFVRSGDIADLHGRVEMCRELLRLCSDTPSDRSDACDRLASALMRVFQHSGTVSALDEAKDLYEEALSLTPTGHPSRMRSCNNLAGALYEKHKQEGALDLLQRALSLQKEHLHLSSAPEADSLARAGALSSLATTMAALDDVSGGHASEEECIALYLEALALLPENSHRPRSIACDGLLTQVQGRFRRTGDLPLLDIAIRYGRDVVALSSPRQPNYRTICNSLAQALFLRYDFRAQPADLNESISLQRMLFSVMMPNHPRRIAACCTLASSLRLEFERTGDMDRLQEALSLQQQAYLMCPEDSTERASVCAGYAKLLWVSANVTMNVAWLDKAIDLFRDSLRLDVQGQQEQSEHLNSLGAYLATRYGVIGDLPSLEEAIQLFRKALELRPPGHVRRADTCFNLGANLLEYVIRVEDLSHMEETICFLKEAGDGGGSRREAADALSYVYLARAYLVPGTPFFDPPSAVMAVRQATEHGLKPTSIVYLTKQLDSLDLSLIPESHMGDMLRAFANVVECLPRLSNATMSFHTRLRTLKSGKNIGAASLRCAILAGDLKTGVELLDNSRAVFWSQALNMRDPQLENLPGGLRTELEHLLGALSSTPALVDGSPLTARDMIHQQNERLQRLIAEVRELPGLSRFMLGTPFEQLVSSFAGTAVVMFSADTGGCRVIVMGGATSRLVHLELEDISIDELEDRTSLLADLGMRLGSNETSLGDDERALGISRRRDGGSQMERLLSKLWLKAMKPVLYALDHQTKAKGSDRPRVVLCPTGPFTFLPLHAAGIHYGDMAARECVSDYVVCSYVPTLLALQRARKGASPKHPSDLSILAIAEGSTPGMPALDRVDQEVRSVCESAEKASLRVLSTRTTGTSTIEHAVSTFADANIVHLACHGVQDAKDALQSGFCLGDGRLTVAKLMELKLPGPFLAFLSACETAKGDETLPDQTVHLAAAMLFCGFQNVIGTMWSMGDEDGPTVACKVYATLFAQDSISAEDVPYALDAAVQDLRWSGLPPSRWATFIHLGA